jgi:ATP synthase protein I
MSQDAPPPRRDGRGPASTVDPWGIVGYLLAGMLIWGGAGWLADRWLGTEWLVLVGLMFGVALAFYVIYVRLWP